VGWWVVLKAPKLSSNGDASAASGMGYSYGDANNGQIQWTGLRLDTDNGAVQSTLNQIYSNPSALAYLMYNDEPPNAPETESFAHAKGVVAYDSNGGFWLVHSVPKFPPVGSSPFSMPDNSYVYGQSFLCLSLGTAAIDQVGSALLVDKPSVYDQNMPSSLAGVSSNIAGVLASQWVTASSAISFNIVTSAGTSFKVFAKNRQWASDLYSGLVAPTLQTSIYVETWMNGPASNKIPTSCAGSKSRYSVINVDQVSLTSSVSWPESSDHSKWAISTDAKSATFCIGDINRQYSQANRGGGTVCGVSAAVWASFNSFNTKSDTCKGYNNGRTMPQALSA